MIHGKNAAEEMEKRRRAIEQKKRQEMLDTKAEAKRRSMMLEDADATRRKNGAGRAVTRTAVVIGRFETALDGPIRNETEPSGADTWWNSTLNKKANDDGALWTETDGEPTAELKETVKQYQGKSVPRGYRGFKDHPPEDEHLANQRDYEDVMVEYKRAERMLLGRTTEAKGTKNARPPWDQPANSFRWVEDMKVLPTKMGKVVHDPDADDAPDPPDPHKKNWVSAEVRAKAAIRLGDISEEMDENETAELLELGVMDPLMDVVIDAEKDDDRTSVWQYLQATKIGNDEAVLRHSRIIHISAARALRNITCVLQDMHSLQPKEGRQVPGTISYDWIPGNSATFLDILIYQPGVYDMMLSLLEHPSLECREHALHIMLHMMHHQDRHKRLILATEGVMDSVRLTMLQSENGSKLQDAAAIVLRRTIHSPASRDTILRHRGPKGESFLPAIANVLNNGSADARGVAADTLWNLTVQQPDVGRLEHPTLEAAKKRDKVARKPGLGRPQETIEDVQRLLGDGITVDYVKQDLCSEAGILPGLVNLLMDGQEKPLTQAAAAVWSLTIDRGNKRNLAQVDGLLKALSHVVDSKSSPDEARRFAGSALRNLATDQWTMNVLCAADKHLIARLLDKCQVNGWQHSIVAPAPNYG
mmetsp:Transcript_54391/g.129595  ORF Transcript_54391/g.129595 Transcript_54391/m.129595 type:complete len:646 (-) Transcript_54391:1028-2965(-)